MSTLLVLLRKDFTNFFRNRAAVSLTFLVPFAMIYVFGQVFGVNKSDSGPTGLPLAVVNASTHPGAQRLLTSLKSEKTFKVISQFTNPDKTTRPLAESDLGPLMHDNAFRFAIVIPPDLVSDDQIGLHLKIYSNPRNEIETQMMNGILQKTIFTAMPQVMGESLQANARRRIGTDKLTRFNRVVGTSIADAFGGNADEITKQIEAGAIVPTTESSDATSTAAAKPADTAASDLLSKMLRIETVQVAGKDVKSPAATHVVSGFAIQFLLFALSSSAAALFYERDRGIFHRILAGPVTRSQILWSKFIYGACLGLLQLVVLFIGGRVLFGIDVEHHLGFLTIVCLATAAACTSFGMLLASISSTAEAASGLATFIILLMCSIGGAWFPVSLMPEFVQHVSRLTIVYWAMEGFDQVLWLNASWVDLLPSLGVLLGMTATVMAIATWRFNRGNIFA